MIPLGDRISWPLTARLPAPDLVEQQEMCHPSASSSELEVDIAHGS